MNCIVGKCWQDIFAYFCLLALFRFKQIKAVQGFEQGNEILLLYQKSKLEQTKLQKHFNWKTESIDFLGLLGILIKGRFLLQ